MRKFKCPECGAEQETIGREVRHKCKGKWRDMQEVKEKDE